MTSNAAGCACAFCWKATATSLMLKGLVFDPTSCAISSGLSLRFVWFPHTGTTNLMGTFEVFPPSRDSSNAAGCACAFCWKATATSLMLKGLVFDPTSCAISSGLSLRFVWFPHTGTTNLMGTFEVFPPSREHLNLWDSLCRPWRQCFDSPVSVWVSGSYSFVLSMLFGFYHSWA